MKGLVMDVMEAWDIKRLRQKKISELELKRQQLNEALKNNDYNSYKINLGLCRNLSATINELTELYEQAIDKEVRGW